MLSAIVFRHTLTVAVLLLFLAAVFVALRDSYRRTGFRVPRAALLSSALGGAFYTLIQGLGVTNLATTFTHSLSITPSLLMARPIIRQAAVTVTAPLLVVSIGTNTITVAAGVGTLTTFDLEVQQMHSLVS